MKKIQVIHILEPVEFGIYMDDNGVLREPNGSIKIYPSPVERPLEYELI